MASEGRLGNAEGLVSAEWKKQTSRRVFQELLIKSHLITIFPRRKVKV